MARKRKKRRRTHFGGGWILKILSFCIICFAILGAMTVFFKVETITVTGESPYTAESIIASSEIKLGENTFFINKFTVIPKIFAKHPYLNEISMRRHLPSELEIIVTQCTPVAVVRGKAQLYLIDGNGKVLEEVTPDTISSYIEITGIEPDEMAVGGKVNFTEKEKEKNLINVLNELKDYGIIKDIRAINMEKLYNMTMVYKDRFTIHLGISDKLHEKLKLVLAIEQQLGPQERGIIDVTDNENIRFRPK